MNKGAIGIFDSGVGGLTVLTEIRKKLRNENIVYLGDTLNFPYGNKSKEEIIEYSKRNVEILMSKGAKIIVIACGTATSQACEVLQKEFDIPIVGIIKPTVEYIQEQKYNEEGVIATEGTIRSGAWEYYLKKSIPDIKVVNKACPMLATIAEEGRATSKEGKAVIKEYMVPFKENKIDKIILGCTHYPIYEDLIRKEMEYDVDLINTGVIVADYLEKYLEEHNIQNTEKKDREEIYLSKPESEFKNIARNIMKVDIEIKNL